MKLAKITLENILGCPDGTYSFADETGEPFDVVAVTGPGGTGKTALLEAICANKEHVGGYGPAPGPERLLRRGSTTGRIASSWVLTDQERRFAGAPSVRCDVELRIDGDTSRIADGTADLRRLFEQFHRSEGLGKFEYFPANRDLHDMGGGGPPQPPLPLALEAASRMGKHPGKYDAVPGTLQEAAMRAATDVLTELRDNGVVLGAPSRDSLEPYRSALHQLTDTIRIDGLVPSGAGSTLRFARQGGYHVDLNELSASERQALLFATTFVRLRLDNSVVLIDEPELHVHPVEQAEALRRLGGLGKNNQIIVATSSAGILRDLQSRQIRVLGASR
ncbi:MAG: AAA family ATPase [Polyangiaceae bacterium]